jgi:O-antigen/teichoic acid export membrane protein
VVGLIAAHGYPAIAPRLLSRYREQGKPGLIAAFIARAERDALVYVAIATPGVLALALWHARARKDPDAIREIAYRVLAFPLAVTVAAMVVVALWGETLLAMFGPEFSGAKLPLLILIACQLARALFGPSVPLLTVIGAQKENAALAIAALAVLAASNLVLAPVYGVLGAAIAVAITILFWLLASAFVLMRLSGLRTDALYLLGRLGQPGRSEL